MTEYLIVGELLVLLVITLFLRKTGPTLTPSAAYAIAAGVVMLWPAFLVGLLLKTLRDE